ncbi:GtrA family protein [Aerococcus urinaeequi]|uniref:GtrA family protein n=1 Tax=Aerococcus urinaeequi TaxID=51665 RepID=UPI003D6A4152
MAFIDKLKKQLFNQEFVIYVVFGVLTTLVNIVSFFLMRQVSSLFVSNAVAWILSIIFAYITNKIWVFKAKNWSVSIILKEFSSFVTFRLLSFLIDMLLMFLLTYLSIGEGWAKLVTQIVVVLLNYIFSKVFIFK